MCVALSAHFTLLHSIDNFHLNNAELRLLAATREHSPDHVVFVVQLVAVGAFSAFGSCVAVLQHPTAACLHGSFEVDTTAATTAALAEGVIDVVVCGDVSFAVALLGFSDIAGIANGTAIAAPSGWLGLAGIASPMGGWN